MIKYYTAVLFAAGMLLLCGCSSYEVSSQQTSESLLADDTVVQEESAPLSLVEFIEDNSEATTAEHSGVDIDVRVEKGDDSMISIVIAPDFFGAADAESIKKEVKQWGATNVMIDAETKFVTAIMTDEAYTAYIAKLKEQVYNTMQHIIDDKEKYPSVFDISANDELTDFTVLCSGTITSEKAITAVDLYLDSAAYQVFSGVLPNNASVNITYIDKDTNKVIDVIDTNQITAK